MKLLTIRLTDEQHADLKARVGLGGMSAYVMNLIWPPTIIHPIEVIDEPYDGPLVTDEDLRRARQATRDVWLRKVNRK